MDHSIMNNLPFASNEFMNYLLKATLAEGTASGSGV